MWKGLSCSADALNEAGALLTPFAASPSVVEGREAFFDFGFVRLGIFVALEKL